ncbi:hypothetical protein WJX75_001817 [Coccomyxa subellipsoidea]|uniref:alpha-1,2-Mannosidase n=1 Tax=Coccomyxa subellipsoidea TaxID=248742 RepID=A0ABR2YQY5_9CHLO
MRHSWNGYVQYAWGADELLPLSRRGGTAFCNTGATLLDALGTLWIMGMRKEFGRARDWVADQMSIDMNCQTSLFELVIRAVGGLLSAYDLSGDEVFLTKAQAIAERMMPAFDTPTGIPRGTINLGTQASAATSWAGGANGAVLSELGSVQMEFIHLSRLTGEPKYGAAAERVIKFLNAKFDQGLLPVYINLETGAATSAQFAMGALSDSYYEYLLKVWVLKGRTDEMYRAMWVRAMDEMLERLVGTSSDGLQYVGDLNGGSFVQRLEHLTCFVAGNLALGVHTGAVNGTRADKYMALARNLTNTCYEMYRRMPTGLGPEQVTFQTGIMSKVTGYNILRPEVVESIFMLYRTTNDTLYRDMGWSIFQAFETYSKVDSGGYSGVVDVGIVPPTKDDKMQSFWLAETLKYLYLLFSPSSTIPLSDWVFNTEAHPFRLGVPATSLTNGTAAAVVGSLS